jgi:hypothetical protein
VPSTSSTDPSTGPLALVIQPDGSARLERMPGPALARSTWIHDTIGGYYEAIGAPAGDGVTWLAYTAEDERHFPGGLAPNWKAHDVAATLGWPWHHDFAKGVLVFVGRQGVDEADVPDYVMRLAGIDPAAA